MLPSALKKNGDFPPAHETITGPNIFVLLQPSILEKVAEKVGRSHNYRVLKETIYLDHFLSGFKWRRIIKTARYGCQTASDETV